MRIDVHIHHHDDEFRDDVIETLEALGVDLNKALEALMATLQEVLDLVTAEGTKEDSIIALLNGVKQQLADALANANLSLENQAKVDAVFAGLTANAGKLDAAIAANTPPAPPAPATPTP